MSFIAVQINVKITRTNKNVNEKSFRLLPSLKFQDRVMPNFNRWN